MSLLAYIPARGGSKRVPGKNMRALGGKPVLVRVIESIRKSGIASAVCVSTDDPRTARAAIDAGATVLGTRAATLSNDRATFMDLLKEDVPRYLRHFDANPARTDVLFALATAALAGPGLYRDAYAAFKRSGRPVLAATSVFSPSPFRALVEKRAGKWGPIFPGKLSARSQDLPEARVDAGLFYFLRYAPMARLRGHWFEAPGGVASYPAPPAIAVDVDTPADWAELERRYRALRRGKGRP